MHRPAPQGIVEILPVRGPAIDEGGPGRRERAPVTERGAWPVVLPGVERCLRIGLVARRNDEPDDIQGKEVAGPQCGIRYLAGADPGDTLCQLLGNRERG